MLDIKYLRDNFSAAEKALATRSGSVDLSGFQQLERTIA